MSALAALTPPFLVCAAVVVAIVAFLRHEMGRGRQDRGTGTGDISGPESTSPDEHDDAGRDADTGASVRRDG